MAAGVAGHCQRPASPAGRRPRGPVLGTQDGLYGFHRADAAAFETDRWKTVEAGRGSLSDRQLVRRTPLVGRSKPSRHCQPQAGPAAGQPANPIPSQSDPSAGPSAGSARSCGGQPGQLMRSPWSAPCEPDWLRPNRAKAHAGRTRSCGVRTAHAGETRSSRAGQFTRAGLAYAESGLLTRAGLAHAEAAQPTRAG